MKVLTLCRRSIGTVGNLKSAVENVVKSPSDKWKYRLDDSVENSLKDEALKPRHHPGIFKPKTIMLPQNLTTAIQNTLEDQDHPRSQILKDITSFVLHLHNKRPPMEEDELKEIVRKLKYEIIDKLKETRPDLLNNKDVIKSQMNNCLKKVVYNWFTIKYDLYKSLLYLLGRTPAEYAVMNKIFSEIHSRDPDWKPRSIFDFGSGVGSVSWAADSVWPKNIFEYFNVDASAEMNDLAEHLLKYIKAKEKSSMKGVYFRQFLPVTPTPYDLVVSAYTLMELPSMKSRLETVEHLWRKVTGYLVLVEQGTNAGFSLINEARDFILNLGDGHVFAPCPHDNVCPRVVKNDGTPCNFEVRYYNLPYNVQTLHNEKYSYIVLKKGKRADDDPQWPRLIRPTLLRHKHCVCNLCTKDGKIEQSVFTASKYGKLVYRCVKSSEWGDCLPVVLKENNGKPAVETDDIEPRNEKIAPDET